MPEQRRRNAVGRTAALLLVALGASIGPCPRADTEPLSLYQRTARAGLVVRARALSSSTRRPRLEVLEIIRGDYGRRRLTVVPHAEDHASPTPWLRREVFREGEESILFLIPYVDEFGRGGDPDVFSVLRADDGKVPVPAEGAGALLDALRRMAAILALGSHDRQAEALRSLMREGNPYLVEAGLEECRRFRLAEPADLESLRALLARRRPEFRAGALGLVTQLLADARSRGEPLAGEQALLQSAAASARLDEDEAVRREAVGALEAFGGAEALSILEAVAEGDASQVVRYEAQVAVTRLRNRPDGR